MTTTEPFICCTCGELSKKHYTLRGTIRKSIGHEPVEHRAHSPESRKGRPTPKRPRRSQSATGRTYPVGGHAASKRGFRHIHGTGRFLPPSIHYETDPETGVRRFAPVPSVLEKRISG